VEAAYDRRDDLALRRWVGDAAQQVAQLPPVPLAEGRQRFGGELQCALEGARGHLINGRPLHCVDNVARC
jgi:hypothetical protein